jgi:hypothetical protein
MVFVLAPDDYWATYRSVPALQTWGPIMQALCHAIWEEIGIAITFLNLGSCPCKPGLNGTHPP